jgi:hypothetical protein
LPTIAGEYVVEEIEVLGHLRGETLMGSGGKDDQASGRLLILDVGEQSAVVWQVLWSKRRCFTNLHLKKSAPSQRP